MTSGKLLLRVESVKVLILEYGDCSGPLLLVLKEVFGTSPTAEHVDIGEKTKDVGDHVATFSSAIDEVRMLLPSYLYVVSRDTGGVNRLDFQLTNRTLRPFTSSKEKQPAYGSPESPKKKMLLDCACIEKAPTRV